MSIRAEIGLNTKPWSAGLSKVEAESSKVCKSIGGQFRGLVVASIGIQALRNATEIADNYLKIAESAGTTVGEIMRMEELGKRHNMTLEQTVALLQERIQLQEDERTKAFIDDWNKGLGQANSATLQLVRGWSAIKGALGYVKDATSRAFSNSKLGLLIRTLGIAFPEEGKPLGKLSLPEAKKAASATGSTASFGLGLNNLQTIGGFARGPAERAAKDSITLLRKIEENTRLAKGAAGTLAGSVQF